MKCLPDLQRSNATILPKITGTESLPLSHRLSNDFETRRTNGAVSFLLSFYINPRTLPWQLDKPSSSTASPLPHPQPVLTNSHHISTKQAAMSTLHFLPHLLCATLLVLTTPICAQSASTPTTSIDNLAAVYERAALKAFSTDSTKQSVIELEGLLARYIKKDKRAGPQVRMLLSVPEQIALYRFLGKELGEEQVKQLEEEPDVCERISTFVGFVFDNAADLLRHGAGLEKNCMRGFQQVLHVREVIRLVLIKMGKAEDAGVFEEVCIDKVLIAVYGWLRGALIGMSRQEGWFRATVKGETNDMRESLKEKRRELLRVKINEILDVEEVKPEPGEDFPEIKGLDGCIETEDDDGESEDDDDESGDDDDESGDGNDESGDDNDESGSSGSGGGDGGNGADNDGTANNGSGNIGEVGDDKGSDGDQDGDAGSV